MILLFEKKINNTFNETLESQKTPEGQMTCTENFQEAVTRSSIPNDRDSSFFVEEEPSVDRSISPAVSSQPSLEQVLVTNNVYYYSEQGQFKWETTTLRFNEKKGFGDDNHTNHFENDMPAKVEFEVRKEIEILDLDKFQISETSEKCEENFNFWKENENNINDQVLVPSG